MNLLQDSTPWTIEPGRDPMKTIIEPFRIKVVEPGTCESRARRQDQLAQSSVTVQGEDPHVRTGR